MSISYTYATLKTALIDFTEERSTEFNTNIDVIIPLAELALLRDLDLVVFDVHTQNAGQFTIGNQSVSKPSGCLVNRGLWLVSAGGSRTLLEPRTVSFVKDYWPTPAAQGTPKYMAELSDTAWLVAPTPSAALSYDLLYTKRPTGLTSANQSTWLGTNTGDALFYACLCNSEEFLKNDPRIPVWKEKYKTEILPAAKFEFRSLVRRDFS